MDRKKQEAIEREKEKERYQREKTEKEVERQRRKQEEADKKREMQEEIMRQMVKNMESPQNSDEILKLVMAQALEEYQRQ